MCFTLNNALFFVFLKNFSAWNEWKVRNKLNRKLFLHFKLSLLNETKKVQKHPTVGHKGAKKYIAKKFMQSELFSKCLIIFWKVIKSYRPIIDCWENEFLQRETLKLICRSYSNDITPLEIQLLFVSDNRMITNL